MRLLPLFVLAACMLLWLPAPRSAQAGSFNCDVVYDEFESLMNRRFLQAPSEFVPTLPGRISKQQFDGVSNANFHLYPGRDGMGIGILTTNQNIHAKFLFHWSQPMADGTVHVIIDEIVKYGRVADGYAPARMGPFRLKPGMTLNVDSGNYIPVEGDMLSDDKRDQRRQSGDLRYEVGDQGSVLTAVNGAQVEFPLETMCRQES